MMAYAQINFSKDITGGQATNLDMQIRLGCIDKLLGTGTKSRDSTANTSRSTQIQHLQNCRIYFLKYGKSLRIKSCAQVSAKRKRKK
jgi:hypothetical protein